MAEQWSGLAEREREREKDSWIVWTRLDKVSRLEWRAMRPVRREADLNLFLSFSLSSSFFIPVVP